MTWTRCSRSPTASRCWSTAASSRRARRKRSAPIGKSALLISARRRPMADNLLEVAGIETCYGQSQVLFGLSLVIARGEMVTLMGRNGMGKTTTVRSIMGLTPARAGAIRFGGDELRLLPAYPMAQRGPGLGPGGAQA